MPNSYNPLIFLLNSITFGGTPIKPEEGSLSSLCYLSIKEDMVKKIINIKCNHKILALHLAVYIMLCVFRQLYSRFCFVAVPV